MERFDCTCMSGYLSLKSFLGVHSCPLALLSENCELFGTENVGANIRTHFSSEMEAVVALELRYPRNINHTTSTQHNTFCNWSALWLPLNELYRKCALSAEGGKRNLMQNTDISRKPAWLAACTRKHSFCLFSLFRLNPFAASEKNLWYPGYSFELLAQASQIHDLRNRSNINDLCKRIE